mmetsp:Transcript_11276/g.32442  ORF Transcript_11276/g.32442 Transcript_11276/m.32442 type:complete len:292 (+) Transcript_11276:842-1717(+)
MLLLLRLAHPKEVGAESDHAALVGLLEKLGRVLRGLCNQSVVVLLGKVPACDEGPNHGQERPDLGLRVGQLVFVEDRSLADKFVGDGFEVAAVRSDGTLQEEPQAELGVARGGHGPSDFMHELEDFAAAELQLRRLVLELDFPHDLDEAECGEHERNQRVLDAFHTSLAKVLAGGHVNGEKCVRVFVPHEVYEASDHLLLRLEGILVLRFEGAVLLSSARTRALRVPQEGLHDAEEALYHGHVAEHLPRADNGTHELESHLLPVLPGQVHEHLPVLVQFEHLESQAGEGHR